MRQYKIKESVIVVRMMPVDAVMVAFALKCICTCNCPRDSFYLEKRAPQNSLDLEDLIKAWRKAVETIPLLHLLIAFRLYVLCTGTVNPVLKSVSCILKCPTPHPWENSFWFLFILRIIWNSSGIAFTFTDSFELALLRRGSSSFFKKTIVYVFSIFRSFSQSPDSQAGHVSWAEKDPVGGIPT